jgi:hypothetical protein
MKMVRHFCAIVFQQHMSLLSDCVDNLARIAYAEALLRIDRLSTIDTFFALLDDNLKVGKDSAKPNASARGSTDLASTNAKPRGLRAITRAAASTVGLTARQTFAVFMAMALNRVPYEDREALAGTPHENDPVSLVIHMTSKDIIHVDRYARQFDGKGTSLSQPVLKRPLEFTSEAVRVHGLQFTLSAHDIYPTVNTKLPGTLI